MKTDILRADHTIAIAHAVDILKHGGLVAFPTDTVYGVATLPFDNEVVERLYVAKGRSSERAIAVLIGDVSQLNLVAKELGATALRLAKLYWPGPLTLIVPKLPNMPDTLSPTVGIGVRIPNHPVALELLRATGPLAVTSANLSGKANPLTAQDVWAQLKGRIDLIIDGGPVPGGVPSTVVDCTSPQPKILRSGPISESELKAILA